MKGKVRCRNATDTVIMDEYNIGFKEKEGQNPILSKILFVLFYIAKRIPNTILDIVMYFRYFLCLNYLSACIAVYHMYAWYTEEMLSPPELECQMAASFQVGAGNQFCMISTCSQLQNHPFKSSSKNP